VNSNLRKISYYDNGNINTEEYYACEGVLHRDGDLPARIQYYEDGTLCCEKFFLNGSLYRDGSLPQAVYYYENGTLKDQEFWIDGRINTVAYYNKDGSVKDTWNRN
jgi:antitoxin component YwqK of YwqJK toxin-antitoxin module